MRRLSWILVGLALAARPAASADAAAGLVGKWESVDRSKGGIGVILEFMPGGSVGMSPGAIVEFPYRLAGNRLTVSDGGPGETQEFEVRFEGDQMIQKEVTTGGEARLVRVGTAPAGEPTIFGVWRNESPAQPLPGLAPELQQAKEIMHQNARTIFTPDGMMLLRIPFVTDVGTYSVTGDQLVMVSRGEEKRATFRIDGDSLFLTYQDGHTRELRRAVW